MEYLYFFLYTLFNINSVVSQTAPFDAREATIESVHDRLFNELNSCRDVVSSFIARIVELNHNVNAIISLNPSALSDADHLDSVLSTGNATAPLFCIPVLLKDNFDAVGMATTGGSLGLVDFVPSVDAPSVAALKHAGAIILGKANLHELALDGLTVSSLGGQTINPYDFTRTPGGSSGGSGAAVAASFAVFATGTDTINSLRNPASANSLFSIRPTRGLISRAGVIPVSFTQDALGPITRTVRDLAMALTAMLTFGIDPADNTTALRPDSSSIMPDYAAFLVPADLKSTRLGVVSTFYNRTAGSETDPVNDAMDAFVSRLHIAGATIVPIDNPLLNSTTILDTYDTQRYEYRESVNSYLSRSNLHGPHPQSLNDIFTTNESGSGGKFLVIPREYEQIKTSLISSTSNTTYAKVQAGIGNLTASLREILESNELDALIYPEQQNLVVKLGSWAQHGRNGILAALTGHPVVTVPVGFSDSTASAPVGIPIGMEILARPWEEQKLLGLALAIEKLGKVRRTPEWANVIVDVDAYHEMPVIQPDRQNIPSAYPIGVL